MLLYESLLSFQKLIEDDKIKDALLQFLKACNLELTKMDIMYKNMSKVAT
jgi:hypothetical protein